MFGPVQSSRPEGRLVLKVFRCLLPDGPEKRYTISKKLVRKENCSCKLEFLNSRLSHSFKDCGGKCDGSHKRVNITESPLEK